MLRRGTWMLVVTALLCMAPAARASGEWMIGLNGGWTFPTGDYGSKDSTGLEANSGPQAGLEVSYLVNNRWAFGASGTWISNTHEAEGDVVDLGGGTTLTANKDKFKILHFGAHAKYLFPVEKPAVRPYAVLGLGMYNLKEDYEYTLAGGGAPTEVFTDENDNAEQPGSRFGGSLGVGALFKVAAKVSIDGRANYHWVSMDKNKFTVSSVQFFGLQAGIVYHVQPNP